MQPSKLLLRQLKRAFGLGTQEQFTNFALRLQHYDISSFPRDVGMLLREFERFLEYIDQTYTQHERDMHLRTRSLDLTSHELLAKNQEIQSYTNALANDLRLPVHALKAHSTLFNEIVHAQPIDHPLLLETLNQVQQAVNSIEQMIEGLLGLSTQNKELRKQLVDLSQLATELVQELQNATPWRTMQVNIAPALYAHADPLAIREVLQNLLSNAWKFAQQNAAPSIHFATVIAENQHSVHPVFYIKDNGIGFPPETAKQLFQPFQKLHQEEGLSGHGMGLATAQHIVHRHGGRIWAENNPAPETGACFYFTLST